MRFYEFEAKQVLRGLRVPLPESRLAHTPEQAEAAAGELGGPVVLKSQVLSGGRMKAGGVKFADTPAEAKQAATDILALRINDLAPVGVLVEERRNVEQEYYAAVTWDTRAKRPVIVFSDMGGIDIEEVAEQHPEHLARVHFSPVQPFSDFHAKLAVAHVGISGGELTALSRIVGALARSFIEHDLTLADADDLNARAHAVYFTEAVGEGKGDSILAFDYELREGIATSTNALKLMRAIGLGGDET